MRFLIVFLACLTASACGSQPAPTQNPLDVNNSTVQASSTTAMVGAPVTVTVTLVDSHGAPKTGLFVNLTATDAAAVRITQPSRATDDAGCATGTVQASDAGTINIAANVIEMSGQVALTEHAVVTYTAAPVASAFAVVMSPLPVVAGANVSVTVTALDAQGATVPSYRGIISLQSTDPGASLPTSYTFEARDKGQVTLPDLSFKLAGPSKLFVSDAATPAMQGAATFEVATSAATVMTVVANTQVLAQQNVQVSVQFADAFGNGKANLSGTLTLSSTDTEAQIEPSVSYVTDANGQLSSIIGYFATPGSQTLTVSDAAIGTTRTIAFDVGQVPPSHCTYSDSNAIYPSNVNIVPNVPSIDGTATSWVLADGSNLPSGLTLDPATGVISGYTIRQDPGEQITITASNSAGQTSCSLFISVVPSPMQ